MKKGLGIMLIVLALTGVGMSLLSACNSEGDDWATQCEALTKEYIKNLDVGNVEKIKKMFCKKEQSQITVQYLYQSIFNQLGVADVNPKAFTCELDSFRKDEAKVTESVELGTKKYELVYKVNFAVDGKGHNQVWKIDFIKEEGKFKIAELYIRTNTLN